MTRKKKWLRRVLVAVACVLVVFCVGFGDYGEQDGDGEATISADEQQQIAADVVAAAMLS